jgi:hypothetical protein
MQPIALIAHQRLARDFQHDAGIGGCGRGVGGHGESLNVYGMAAAKRAFSLGTFATGGNMA